MGRIITFFGVPVFGGLAIFVGAFFYSKKYDVVVQVSGKILPRSSLVLSRIEVSISLYISILMQCVLYNVEGCIRLLALVFFYHTL